jgi:glycosyltransferase involved in cell wall biosynthesis
MLYSIIIRAKNEEAWIGRCLKSVFSQSERSFEVIIVDNNSVDDTVSIAKQFPIKEVLNIEKFLAVFFWLHICQKVFS